MRFSARPDIPIYVSASGPKTLELAGEIADGVILLVGLFPEALAWALEHVERGAAKAGRPRPHVAVFAYGAIDEDRDAAMESARTIAAWFPQTSPAICELCGAPGRPRRGRAGSLRGRGVPGGDGGGPPAPRCVRALRGVGRGHRATHANGSPRSPTRARTRSTCSRWGQPHADGRGLRRLPHRRRRK